VSLGAVVAAVFAAICAMPGVLAAEGGVLVGTVVRGPVMVGASPGGLDAYRVVAAATGASNRLWLLVGDGTKATSVVVGVYDDTGARLLGSCAITPPAVLPGWSSCSMPRAMQTTAGHVYWLALSHAQSPVVWWAEAGGVCQARFVFFRSAGLSDPFPMAQSTCAEAGTNVAMYLGDVQPTADAQSQPTPAAMPTVQSTVDATSGSACYRVTVNGAPGGNVEVQGQPGPCPSPAASGDGQAAPAPGDNSAGQVGADDNPLPASTIGSAVDENDDMGASR
jgi:hypothetical protein